MRRSDLLEGIRMLKFGKIHERYDAGELSQLEAAELLGVGERLFRRWCGRYREEGAAGLEDRRLGTPAHNRVPVADADAIERLYRSKYSGFTAKHFHEHLVQGGSAGATRGPSRCCSVVGCWMWRVAVARTGASGRGDRWRE